MMMNEPKRALCTGTVGWYPYSSFLRFLKRILTLQSDSRACAISPEHCDGDSFVASLRFPVLETFFCWRDAPLFAVDDLE